MPGKKNAVGVEREYGDLPEEKVQPYPQALAGFALAQVK